jgi:hypothetical protein
MGDTSNSSSFKTIKCPSKSPEQDIFLRSRENALNKDSDLCCGILNRIIENIFSFGNKTGSVKSESLVTNTYFSDFESSANLASEKHCGAIFF